MITTWHPPSKKTFRNQRRQWTPDVAGKYRSERVEGNDAKKCQNIIFMSGPWLIRNQICPVCLQLKQGVGGVFWNLAPGGSVSDPECIMAGSGALGNGGDVGQWFFTLPKAQYNTIAPEDMDAMVASHISSWRG